MQDATNVLKEEGYKCLIKYNITSISVDGDSATVQVSANECNMVRSKTFEFSGIPFVTG